MHVGIMTVKFHLNGCRSLKEKRQRLGGLRERFGKAVNVAVCESGHQDSLQRAQWTFAAVASTGVVVEKTLTEILTALELSVDAQLVGVEREILQ